MPDFSFDFNYIKFAAILLLLFFLLRLIHKFRHRGLPDYYPYEQKQLLTRTEYAFYRILKEKCDTYGFLICPKVRMEDFINVTDRENSMKYRGYIKSRHIDFMICDEDLNILFGLELDDSSHNTREAWRPDTLKNKVFDAIELPLYRIPTNCDYEKEIKKILKNYI